MHCLYLTCRVTWPDSRNEGSNYVHTHIHPYTTHAHTHAHIAHLPPHTCTTPHMHHPTYAPPHTCTTLYHSWSTRSRRRMDMWLSAFPARVLALTRSCWRGPSSALKGPSLRLWKSSKTWSVLGVSALGFTVHVHIGFLCIYISALWFTVVYCSLLWFTVRLHLVHWGLLCMYISALWFVLCMYISALWFTMHVHCGLLGMYISTL